MANDATLSSPPNGARPLAVAATTGPKTGRLDFGPGFPKCRNSPMSRASEMEP